MGQMTLRDIVERGDLDEFAAHLDPDVVWVGVLPGQLCRNREQVLEIFRNALATGKRAAPEILIESTELMVLDPHIEPAPEQNPKLHQVFVVDEGRVVEIRDYPNRASALAAAEGV
jgi:ketosteroid isomerase-like protein